MVLMLTLTRGHYAVLFGKALGAHITVFSRSDAKKADALKMGADRFVATATPGWEKEMERELDLIICTASGNNLPMDGLLSSLDVECKLIFMGLPEEGISNIKTSSMCGNAAFLGSSHLGNRAEMKSMLELAAEKNVKPWIQVMQMKDAAKAIKAVEDGSVRYRSILIQVSWATQGALPASCPCLKDER